MSIAYLGILCVLLACMVLVDARWGLFFWRDAVAAVIVSVCGVGGLLLVDVAGIALGIFARAPTSAMTGILLGPELPLEEPFFLAFLVYLTMNLVAIAARVLVRVRARR
jgi:lycopene cyclase domain-containing protein